MRTGWHSRRDGVVQTNGGSMFTGVVWAEVLLPHADDVGVNRVTFAPGSRTVWHRHCGGQMLIGCAGSGLVVTHDGVQPISEGIVVHAFAGELHWHGALPDAFMSHTSIVLGGDTEWFEEVSEADYAPRLRIYLATVQPRAIADPFSILRADVAWGADIPAYA